MTLQEFQDLLEQLAREAEMFEDIQRGLPLTESEFEAAEDALSTRFPEEYRQFLQTFGGPDFLTETIYVVDSASADNIVDANRSESIPAGYVAFSPNFCGDFYLFRMENGRCLSEVWFYDHETNAVWPTGKGDLFDHLASCLLD